MHAEDMTHWWDRSVWENPDRSYPWYPPERVAPPAPESPPTPPPPLPRKSIRELTTTKDIREELDRLKDEAVINPTKENVRTYLEAQQYVMGKGSTFADMARRVVWETAELDYSLRRPTNALAIDAFKSSAARHARPGDRTARQRERAVLLLPRRLPVLPSARPDPEVSAGRARHRGLPGQPGWRPAAAVPARLPGQRHQPRARGRAGAGALPQLEDRAPGATDRLRRARGRRDPRAHVRPHPDSSPARTSRRSPMRARAAVLACLFDAAALQPRHGSRLRHDRLLQRGGALREHHRTRAPIAARRWDSSPAAACSCARRNALTSSPRWRART